MGKNKIMVVEDDCTLLDVIKYNLVKEGYLLSTADDGIKALDIAREFKPDLVILDIMLPGMNGFEVCRILRKDINIPIIFLSARADEIDKVVGLDIGADDYITKPFSMRELLARIRANLRRTEITGHGGIKPEMVMVTGNLSLDASRRRVTLNDLEIVLTTREFDLLAFLLKNKGMVFSRDQLLEKVWGYDYAGDTRTVDVHIRWLRQKLEEHPDNPKRLLTVRGVGYKLEG
jgi:two-component system OmpR family response regulator